MPPPAGNTPTDQWGQVYQRMQGAATRATNDVFDCGSSDAESRPPVAARPIHRQWKLDGARPSAWDNNNDQSLISAGNDPGSHRPPRGLRGDLSPGQRDGHREPAFGAAEKRRNCRRRDDSPPRAVARGHRNHQGIQGHRHIGQRTAARRRAAARQRRARWRADRRSRSTSKAPNCARSSATS